MKKEVVQRELIKLIGITTRTDNSNIFSSDIQNNKIAATVQKYFHHQVSEKIPNRKNPGTTYCVYTNYESDYTGEYTYFIGEEASCLDKFDEALESLIIPPQTYIKFTNESGPMPEVCIDMWKTIWPLDASELGGERAYIADFEIYDERSKDHQNVILDIYIGIKK